MTRIGSDVKLTEGQSLWGDPIHALQHIADQGLQGVSVRTIDELSPTLDHGVLREFAAAAEHLHLYVEMGVGKVNPYMTAELPRVRDLGRGSYLDGMTRMIEASAAMGWTTLWSALGGIKIPLMGGLFYTDRFRTDADWADQLRIAEKFLHRLAPALRANGCVLALETHEEVTSFELVRLIEAVGDDVLGVCLDPANLLTRGEVPLDGVRRVAPYVRSTQLRDAVLLPDGEVISRFLAPCGDGLIDWTELLTIVLSHRPDLNLTIEGIGGTRVEMRLQINDPTWLAAHPDQKPSDLEYLRAEAAAHDKLAAAGGTAGIAELRQPESPLPAHDNFVRACAAHLRSCLDTIASPLPA